MNPYETPYCVKTENSPVSLAGVFFCCLFPILLIWVWIDVEILAKNFRYWRDVDNNNIMKATRCFLVGIAACLDGMFKFFVLLYF